MEQYPPNRWPEAVIGQWEALQRSADEDAGGMDGVIDSGLTIDEQYAGACFAQSSGALKAGEAGSDDEDVHAGCHALSPVWRVSHEAGGVCMDRVVRGAVYRHGLWTCALAAVGGKGMERWTGANTIKNFELQSQ